MNRTLLLSFGALIALALSSCSSTGFMQRKYLPGHFFDKEVTVKGDDQKSDHTLTSRAFKTDHSIITTETVNSVPSPVVGHVSNIPPGEIKKAPHTLKSVLLHVLPFKKILTKNPVTNKPLFKSSGKRKGLAWLALLFGILTFYPYAVSTLTAALLAIIFGMIQIHRVNKDSSEFGGKGIAFLGMLLGIIGVAIVFLFLLAAAAA